MRPVKLILQAWGPFAEKEEVDFSVLRNNMFLITGPTGSGKTTIFDGIAYALYGNVSGAVREKNGLRSDFAKEDVESFVELEFVQHGKHYHVRRTPRYERAKKRGTGFVTSPETAMFQQDGEAPVTVLQEVNRRLEELLGMNYGQFRQIAMLAQGEFMNLLVQASPERVEILRSVFQTDLFERLQKRLNEESRVLAGKSEALRERMKEAAGSIRAEEGSPLYALLQEENLHYEAILQAAEKEQKRQVEQEKSRKKELTEHQECMHLLTVKQKELAELASKQEEFRRIVLQWEEYENEKPMRKQQRERLRLAQLAQVVRSEEVCYRLAEKRRKEAVLQLEHLQQEEQEWEPRLREAERLRAGQEKLAAQKKMLEQLVSKAQEAEHRQQELQKKEKELEEKRKACEEAEKKELAGKQIYEELEHAYRDAVLGRVASTLQDGQPCPVCGSVHHPSPAFLPEQTPDEQEVKQARSSYETLHDAMERQMAELVAQRAILNEKQTLLAALREEVENGLVELDDSNAGQDQRVKHEAEAKALRRSDPDESQDRCDKTEERQSAEETWKQKVKAVTDLLQDVAQEYARRETEMKVCDRQSESMLARRQEWTKLSEQGESESVLAEQRYQSALKAQGFQSEKEYQTAWIEPERREREERALVAYEQASLQLTAKKKMLEEELAKREQTEESVQEAIQSTEKAMEEERICVQKMQEQLDTLHLTIQINRAAIETLEEKLQQSARVADQYGILQDLARTASGGNAKHLVLEQYVLSVYMEEIIRLANLRLWPMTMGRYELSKVERVGDARTRDYLGLEIRDAYTGKKRSVKSLSGGESFKAALALALGLADMIQSYAGGIEIDMLFIDEGFGSLDEESLEQAVSTLQRLAGEHKQIGIISHVAELKERLSEQVVVKKTSAGSHIEQR